MMARKHAVFPEVRKCHEVSALVKSAVLVGDPYLDARDVDT
jgi:hypothetical protein